MDARSTVGAHTHLSSWALSRSISILVKSAVCSCAFSPRRFFSNPLAFHPCPIDKVTHARAHDCAQSGATQSDRATCSFLY
jgi:hypothetical protein